SGGKNIAPSKIETYFSNEPLFEQVVVLGNNRAHLVALVYPNLDLCRGMKPPELERLLLARIAAINKHLAPFETIKKMALLEKPLAAERGELTLSLKPRRQRLEKIYAALLEKLYKT